jgi:sulfatase modifying factor 1
MRRPHDVLSRYRLISGVLLAGSVMSGVGLPAQPSTYTNSIGMEFALIAPGEMIVGKFEPPYAQPGGAGRAGSLSAEQYREVEVQARAAYLPGFPVKIDRAYYIAKYEVTQAQWKKVMGTNPSMFQGRQVTDDPDQHPVDNVMWDDAQAFIKKLNALEETQAYRLPTEFEWEYAARARNDGNVAVPPYTEQAVAGFNMNTSTHRVGEKKPNAWGLYDMLGNVWEWVQDYYNGRLFADPTPSQSGTQHVLKGGSFLSASNNTIPATHAGGPGSGFDVGFRVLREAR